MGLLSPTIETRHSPPKGGGERKEDDFRKPEPPLDYPVEDPVDDPGKQIPSEPEIYTDYWKELDAEIANIQMPEEYANDMRDIICNDCGITSNVTFHVVGMKCLNEECGSYNTKMK